MSRGGSSHLIFKFWGNMFEKYQYIEYNENSF